MLYGFKGVSEPVLIDSVGPSFELIKKGLVCFFIVFVHQIYLSNPLRKPPSTSSYLWWTHAEKETSFMGRSSV